MGKSTISMAMFKSKLFVYRRRGGFFSWQRNHQAMGDATHLAPGMMPPEPATQLLQLQFMAVHLMIWGINTWVYHGYTMVFRTHLRYFQWGISDELGWFHVPVLLQFSLKLTLGSTVSDFRRAAGIWHEPAGDVWLPASSHPGNDTVMHLFGWSKVAN